MTSDPSISEPTPPEPARSEPVPSEPAIREPAILGDAIRTVYRELTDIRESMPRCGRCENFRAVVRQVCGDLRGVAAPDAADTREELAAWLVESEGRIKTTDHCEVCVPAGPYERFTAALAQASRDAAGSA